MKKIKNIIKKIIKFLNDYDILTNASSIAFYMVLSLSSFVILLIGVLLSSNLFSEFLIANIISIFGSAVNVLVSEMISLLSLSKYSYILILSALFYSSSVLTNIRLYTLKVYKDYPSNGYIYNKLSSFFVYLLLICLVLIILVINFYSTYFFINILRINNIFRNIYVFISELSLYYLIVFTLNMYLPPKKMRFKDVWKVSLFVTMAIYLCIAIIKLVSDLILNLGIAMQIVYIISTFGLLIYIILIIILFGVVKIYQANK